MMKLYGGGFSGMPQEMTLVLNMSNPLTKKLADSVVEGVADELSEKIAKQIYMLALVAQRPLEADELAELIGGSAELFAKIQ